MLRDMEEKRIGRLHGHSISIDERERVMITGVQDVESFNEDEVHLLTEAGGISIVGQGLHISRLNLDEGQLIVEGFIDALEYQEIKANKGGVFSRLFR